MNETSTHVMRYRLKNEKKRKEKKRTKEGSTVRPQTCVESCELEHGPTDDECCCVRVDA